MIRFTRFALLLTLGIITAGGSAIAQEKSADKSLPAPVKTMTLEDGDCLVFLGDSITHQCLYTQYVEDFFFTRFPQKRIKLHNAGVGGAQAWDALQRFEKDVAAYEPEYVTIILGMNDGRYQPFNQEIFDTYEQDMTILIKEIDAIGAVPILMTPTMYDARVARSRKDGKPSDGEQARWEYYNSVLAYFGTWLRRQAYTNGYGMVDMWSPLNNITLEQRQTNPDFNMIPDSVHPNADGHVVMAMAILDDMNLAGPLSSIRINLRGKKPKSRAKGGELSELKQTENAVSFTWKANALPFVVPTEAQEGADLTHLGHRASRETLVVSGLPAGRYELLIDGKAVGKYSAARLADGIQLQNNEKTPQYQQAMKVAMLNKKRNDGPVHDLRGQWSLFQRYARTKRAVDEQPDNKKTAAALKKLEQQIAGMEERVKKAEAESKTIVDQIFEVNQPQAHEYELRRVGGRGQADRQSNRGNAVVAGRVTLNGKPLAKAKLVLTGAQRKFQTTTNAQGAFKFQKKLPNGDYSVVISAKTVPARYSDASKSSLRVSVQEGENVFDFDLAK